MLLAFVEDDKSALDQNWGDNFPRSDGTNDGYVVFSELDNYATNSRECNNFWEKKTIWLGRVLEYELRFEPILMHIHQQLAFKSLGNLSANVKAKGRQMRLLDIGANCGRFGFAAKATNQSIQCRNLSHVACFKQKAT